MNFTHRMGLPHYIQALQAERRKIQVFSKELPLSLDLVTQAIEACRLQLSAGTTTSEFYHLNGHQSECCSGQTSSEGPVLEEFIPIKKRASSDCCHQDEEQEDEDEDEQHSHKPKIARDNHDTTDKAKSDWLRSVQLWNPQSPLTLTEHVPKKASVLEVKRNGGAFQPFHKDTSVNKAPSSMSPPPPPVAAASSTAGGVVAGGNGRSDKKEEKQGQSQRKQRRCWSQELHKRFLHALEQLGGADSATPKQIRELMKVDGLTNDEVKSHLQKFRLHTRRPSPMIQNNVNSQAAPFVIVGNFIMQPPEYASKASREVTTLAAPPSGIYTPAAAHPPAAPHTAVPLKVELRQMEHCEHSNSEERGNRSEVAYHSNSPTSSSTHT